MYREGLEIFDRVSGYVAAAAYGEVYIHYGSSRSLETLWPGKV